MRVVHHQVIEELLRNDRQVLRRARQPGKDASVLLKSPINRPASPADIELLRHELEILEAMTVFGVPRPLGLSEQEEDAWLSLEDTGGVALDSIAASFPGNLNYFFKFSVQLVMTLGEIHRVNVIHRAISPRSILVEPPGGLLHAA